MMKYFGMVLFVAFALCLSGPFISCDDGNDIDPNDYFGDCESSPDGQCDQLRCAQKRSYESCLSMYAEEACDGFLECVYAQQSCACPGGVYDESAADQCNSTFTTCQNDFWKSRDACDGDTGEADTVENETGEG